jgi:hypothetical protein
MFDQYQLTPAAVSDMAVQMAKAFSQNRPGLNPAVFAGQVIAKRLTAKPLCYLEFGPYWWAVKSALASLGHDFGAQRDGVIQAHYGGGLPVYGALVAGEYFKDVYRRTFLAGSHKFQLSGEGGESYLLVDMDMEGLAQGLPIAREQVSTESAEEVITDSVQEVAVPATPFRVTFEMDGDVWSANLYCDGIDTARDRVRSLERGGQIGRAVDAAKGIRPLPEQDQGFVADVDLKGRRVLIG